LHESPLKAAQRELQEETGLSAGHWSELMRLHMSNSITDELGIIFVARDLTEGPASLEESEDITVRTVAIDQAIQMVEDGDITDALTVAGLLRFSCDQGTETI
jgi:8-oxo-dGTP pyrophosphatase MutT (NUDIX family)